MPEIMQMPENMRLVLLAAQVMVELLVLNEKKNNQKSGNCKCFCSKESCVSNSVRET